MTRDGRDGIDDMPMWEDPQESSALRQLLRAGHVENSDYDVERGLARHIAQMQAGAPLPAWAVQTTLHKSAGWSLLAWILPPMISAGVVGAWLAIRPADPTPLAAAAARESSAQQAGEAAGANVTGVARASTSNAAPTVAEGLALVAAPAATQESAAPSVNEHDAADQRERRDHHTVAAVRGARSSSASTATGSRTLSARRGRLARSDDSYASAGLGRGASGAGTPSGIDASGTAIPATGSVAASTTAAGGSKAAASEELAAKQEPAAEDAQDSAKAKDKAKDTQAKAKPERRAKEDEAAQDEVTGARLEREMRMLAVAQRVLTEDPARSLKLCRQGESEFRGSMFSAERKQVALLALVQLGKVDQARREGIPFLRAFPNAPWSARLREALSSGRVPNP